MSKKRSSAEPINSLDSIVTKLQWAAVGKSEDINSGADIDKYVSELILEEAKKSNNLYNKLGPRAYLDPSTGSEPCILKKTNKTFLRNIVRNTNCHNRIVERTSNNSTYKSQSSTYKKPYKEPYGKNKFRLATPKIESSAYSISVEHPARKDGQYKNHEATHKYKSK